MNREEKIIEWLEDNGKDVYTYSEIEDLYEETLDEVYDDIVIGELTFSAGEIVRNLDPGGFRCGADDWASEEFEEIGNVYARKDDYDDADEALSEEEESEN